MAKETETPVETVPAPEKVEAPPGSVTEETVENAEALVKKAEENIEAAPSGPEKDQALRTLEEIRDAVKNLAEKVERAGGVVQPHDVTPEEQEIAAVANPRFAERFLRDLDAALS